MLRRALTRLQMQPTAKVQSHEKFDLAHYPHMALTVGASPVSADDFKLPSFLLRTEHLEAAAKELDCFSICAPKIKWDAHVIMQRADPTSEKFETFVNPDVPGYDDRNTVAPMYGMWETDTALSACAAWVIRPQFITVNYQDEVGNPHSRILDGMTARLFMHEYDFLRGKSMLQMVLDTDFIVPLPAVSQMNLWPAGHPSMEAQMTPVGLFFDYVSNQVVVPKGLEWMSEMQQQNQQFSSEQIPK